MCSRRADFTPFIEFIPSCIHPYHFDQGKRRIFFLRNGGSNFGRISDASKRKARLTYKDSHFVFQEVGSQLSPKPLSPAPSSIAPPLIDLSFFQLASWALQLEG